MGSVAVALPFAELVLRMSLGQLFSTVFADDRSCAVAVVRGCNVIFVDCR